MWLNLIPVFLFLIANISFLIVIWKKPKIPIRTFSFAALVFFLSFCYQQTLKAEKHFLPINNSFILLESRDGNSTQTNQFSFLYGTNKTIEDVRAYYRSLTQQFSLVERIIGFFPGGEFFNLKKIEEYGDIKDGSILLNYQFGIQNHASIDIYSPPVTKKASEYKTEVHLQYQFAHNRLIKTYLIIIPLLLISSLLWAWMVVIIVKEVKNFTIFTKDKQQKKRV